jgi:hypothetical protein
MASWSVPRAPFTVKPGMLSSAESSPYTPFVPLRKVTNPDPETETEGGTLKRSNSLLRRSRPWWMRRLCRPFPRLRGSLLPAHLTQEGERKLEERERGFKSVQRDPRLLALAEIINPSARKPVPELSVSPAKDEEPMLVFTTSPTTEETTTPTRIPNPPSRLPLSTRSWTSPLSRPRQLSLQVA